MEMTGAMAGKSLFLKRAVLFAAQCRSMQAEFNAAPDISRQPWPSGQAGRSHPRDEPEDYLEDYLMKIGWRAFRGGPFDRPMPLAIIASAAAAALRPA
jgi:hypothetical protein